MAGGKETPRQKMIGMMYLVLTALLALQIKDTVLEKFILIENGLQVSNSALLDYNQRTLADIESDYVNQGEKSGDEAVFNTAKNVRKYTNGLIAYLDNLKYEVGKAAAKGDTSKVYERSTLKKYEEPSNYLVNQNYAEELKAKLDEYPEQVNSAISFLGKEGMNVEWMKSIAIDANDIKFYENNQEEKKKDYAHFNFYKAPLASILAQITFYKNQIYAKESEALNKLKSLVGSAVTVDPASVPDLGGLESAPAAATEEVASADTGTDEASNTPQTTPRRNNSGNSEGTEIGPDDLLKGRFAGIDYAQATILSESNLVTQGLDFNAQAFLTLGNSSLQPTVKLNGEEIDVVNGRGIVNFKATGGNYDENGLVTKTFDIEIVADDGTGNQISRTTTHEYTVAKPVIDVRSQSVEVLYLNCANNLNINVPSLGPAYQPSFNVKGGTYTNGSQKGQILVDPKQREVSIDVSSAGLFIGTREFQAKRVPLPRLDVRPDGQAYDANAGLDDKPSSLRLFLAPDADFAERLPNDANFLVSKGQVLLSRGKTRKRAINIESPTASINLSAIRNQMQSGDRIVVSVEEIVRINYKNESLPIQFTGAVTLNIN